MIVSQQAKMANPDLPEFVTVKKLENKTSVSGIDVNEVKKADPVVELLESPSWKHRKEDVQFSPFKPNCNLMKKTPNRRMGRISLIDCSGSKRGRVASQAGSSRNVSISSKKSGSPEVS